MNLPHNKFCVLPWVSLEASPIGTVRPCCLADDEILDNNGAKCKLAEMKFEDIRNTDHMRRLREEFLAGRQPETCRRCWAEEDAGRTSKRMHTLERLKHILGEETWEVESKPLMFLDLKLGNICNLKCRICGSWSSSQYAVEELKYSPDKKTSFHYIMLEKGRWPRESPEFWTELENNMGAIRYLEFTGGEPFMIEEHFELLRRLVDRGYASNIEIHYNTNGTIYPDAAEAIWANFKTVEIALSIDDVGARFEYQRSNAVWAEVEANLERFRQLRSRHKNIQLQVCTTVNVFNVRYLEHVARWIPQQGFDFVYWNMLHDSPELSIAGLPENAKLLIADHLRYVNIPPEYRREFDRIIDFMMRGINGNGEDLTRKIRQLDQRRGESLVSVMPELAAALNYHG